MVRRTRRGFRSPDAERKAWQIAFRSGFDYLGELALLGLTVDDMEAAWSRHGEDFLATWEPGYARQFPCAFEKFGAPWK